MVPDATNAKSRFAGENCARTWRTRDGDAIRRARSRAVAALRQTYENIRRRTRTVTPVETQRNRAAGRCRGTVAEMDCCEWPAGLFRFARRLGLVPVTGGPAAGRLACPAPSPAAAHAAPAATRVRPRIESMPPLGMISGRVGSQASGLSAYG